ncbi:hypothetical protein [Methylobacterium haplocladii]|uniref:Uncharacterized protein n=1 Tax=Methylobacterium haplocladii TaxID=1176176 RepID=A0A512IUI3_9HYPH|nr:hypothetical protein [Methylobacterium haplocladii]GEP01357.1 hypothetical protein MHA02_37440 [Methylobacterium haplocladii]GJD83841.1 hypothetical protein HPGCJGGD_1714 [Methylobacterium haplocladii]GLS58248.1 hypothetical protein GCM10007887_09060 [Methylobacterium haplocladii]
MSEPARNTILHDTGLRPSSTSGPLRDWLAAMRATAPESRQPEAEAPQATAAPAADAKTVGWAPRLVVPDETPQAQDDEVAELIAENMMLKAKLRLEADRRDELQLLLAQEVRELRSHIGEEIAKMEDLRGERDLWKARCEALMQPLFSGQAR